MIDRALLGSCATLTTLLVATAASAQQAPTFTESFYAIPLGDAEEVSAQCARSFSQPLTNSGAFVGRSSTEVSEVVSTCVESRLSAEFSRECDLAIAQSEVDYIVLSEAREVDESWLFEVVVQRPAMDASVWSSDAVGAGESPVLLAREHCAALGEAFVAQVHGEAPEGPTADVEQREVTPVVGEPWQQQGPRLRLTSGVSMQEVAVTDASGRTRYCLRDGMETPGVGIDYTTECLIDNMPEGPTTLQLEDIGALPHELAFVMQGPITTIDVQHAGQRRGGWRWVGMGMMLGSSAPLVATLGSDDFVYGIAATGVLLAAGTTMMVYGFNGERSYDFEVSP